MDIQVGWPTHDAGGYVKWINGKEDARFGKNKTLVCNALSILGAEGWELVAVDNPNGHGTNDPHYLLKRPTSLTSSAWLAWFATAVAPRTMQAPESPVRRRRPWRTDGPARIWSRSRRR
jgi:hypothetical protein